jgi:hypothetical protein
LRAKKHPTTKMSFRSEPAGKLLTAFRRDRLAAPVYAGMLAPKPIEVKLFRGHNLLPIGVSTSGVPGGAARRAENVVLIRGIAGNLPLPPPIASENVNQFLPHARKCQFAQREGFVVH